MYCIANVVGSLRQMKRQGAIFGEEGKNIGNWGILVCAQIYNSDNYVVLILVGDRHSIIKISLYYSSKKYDPMTEKEHNGLKLARVFDLESVDMHPINKRAWWLVNSLNFFGPISANKLAEKIASELKAVCKEMKQHDDAIMAEAKRIMIERNRATLGRRNLLKNTSKFFI